MKRNRIRPALAGVLLTGLLLVAVLAGCTTGIERIEPNNVERIEVASSPASDTLPARTYADREQIGRIVSYLNDLRLTTHFSENPDEYCGQTFYLTLVCTDGSMRKFTHFGNLFFREGDGAWRRMEYEQAAQLEMMLRELSEDGSSENGAAWDG